MSDENKTIDAEELLREARDLKVAEIIVPAIILTVVVAVLGIIPNCVTVAFFGFKAKTKSSAIMLITALAVSDFVVSVYLFVIFLFNFSNIYYSKETTCRIGRCIANWVVSLSIGILWLISINNYRMMCCVSGWQLKIKSTKFALLGMFIFTLVVSLREVWLYDAVEFNITVATRNASVIGHYCTNTDDPDLQTAVVAFHIADIVMCAIILCTFAFTYGRIWWTIRQINIGMSKDNAAGLPRSVHTLLKREKKMSKMMFFVSMGFVVCFVPFYVSMILQMNSDKTGYELQPWFRLITRTPALNSILNPIIYCISNKRYRKYVKSLLFCSCLKKNSADNSVSNTHNEQVMDTEECTFELI